MRRNLIAANPRSPITLSPIPSVKHLTFFGRAYRSVAQDCRLSIAEASVPLGLVRRPTLRVTLRTRQARLPRRTPVSGELIRWKRNDRIREAGSHQERNHQMV